MNLIHFEKFFTTSNATRDTFAFFPVSLLIVTDGMEVIHLNDDYQPKPAIPTSKDGFYFRLAVEVTDISGHRGRFTAAFCDAAHRALLIDGDRFDGLHGSLEKIWNFTPDHRWPSTPDLLGYLVIVSNQHSTLRGLLGKTADDVTPWLESFCLKPIFLNPSNYLDSLLSQMAMDLAQSSSLCPSVRLALLSPDVDGGVGKTAFVERYMTDFFITDYDPSIETVYSPIIPFPGGRKGTIEILDTGRSEYQDALSIIKRADGFLLFYSEVASGSREGISAF